MWLTHRVSVLVGEDNSLSSLNFKEIAILLNGGTCSGATVLPQHDGAVTAHLPIVRANPRHLVLDLDQKEDLLL